MNQALRDKLFDRCRAMEIDGKIQCRTCHNPHGKGVLKGEAGIGAGSQWRVPDFREVCAPCHGRY